uniref:DUF1640 domain-containing protein n=1 Tax=Candidatus Kentrum sp. DK TaxID=2126562 RepID=A0A450S6D7_9GAMM|nr:MAG: hypothetical protein BECKDK2373C_GA0170839_101833 [Candidatus Kentron sp. DK]
MTAITFDTLKFANRLKAADVTSKQAEALAEVFSSSARELATKSDIGQLGVQLHSEMREMESRLIQWIAAPAFAQIGLLAVVLLKIG